MSNLYAATCLESRSKGVYSRPLMVAVCALDVTSATLLYYLHMHVEELRATTCHESKFVVCKKSLDCEPVSRPCHTGVGQ